MERKINNLVRRGFKRLGKIDDIVVPIVKTSEDAESAWNGQPVELLWIDGSHEYEFVCLDYKLWEPYLIEGGIIAFHDTLGGGPKGVVDKYIYKGNRFRGIRFVHGIVFAEKSGDITIKDKIKNRYALFLRNVYIIFTEKLGVPKSIRVIGKKVIKLIQ